MGLKCLVFDCDGVLIDSVPIKTRAFARLAEPYGAEARDRLVMYHTVHGGVSRYLKFAWFFREILEREITPEESREWGERFAEYALDEVRKCPLIAGVEDVLKAWRGKLGMYVCTGAPREEQAFVLRERGLEEYFDGIFGSPPGKGQLLTHIVRDVAKVEPEEAVMVGDSGTDRDAAEEAGTLFYGIGAGMKGGSFPWGMDLTHFNAWVEKNL